MSDFVRAYYGDEWMGLVVGLWRLTRSIPISVMILERSVEIVKTKVAYDSSLLRYETYLNKKLHGLSRFVRADGSVIYDMMYRNGLKEGYFRKWNSKGQLTRRSMIHNNKMHGIGQEWDPEGHLIRELTYRNGLKEGSFRMWYSNGQLRDSYAFYKGVIHGFYRHWHSNGQLSEMSMYGNGEIHGLFRKWNMSGQLTHESFYRAGTKVGVTKNWSPTGELLSPDDIPTYDLIFSHGV